MSPSRIGLLVLVALVPIASRLDAQGGRIQGIVVDSAGDPIRDADVGIVVLRRLTRTDTAGRFALTRLPLGKIELSVRRLSYEPRIMSLMIGEPGMDSLRIVLAANAALLDLVHVSVAEMRRREQIEDFYRRRTRGIGTFITRQEVESRVSGAPSDLLRNTPGIRFVRVASGRGIRFPTTSISRRDCAPMIWIDGQKAPGMEIDDVTLTDIEGIELYNGPSTTPFQFSQGVGNTTCGTIAIWSRPPTPRRRP